MNYICGLDEVGRGPLAGPVVAAAVVFPESQVGENLARLTDSKKLSHNRRLSLIEPIKQFALAWATGWVWQSEIDKINIHNASLLAMVRAVDTMIDSFPSAGYESMSIFVDGKFVPNFKKSKHAERILQLEQAAVIKGDSSIPAISAASIIAKVERDLWMIQYHSTEPLYGFDRHKGYPTAYHKEAIRKNGPSAIQRMSFSF